MMAEVPKEKLAKVIDKLIDSSVKLNKLEVTLKGISNSIENTIDEISTTLYFHYLEDEDSEEE